MIGALDAVLILYRPDTDTYHAAYFTEAPMPGPVEPIDKLSFVRLRSRMHHTVGAPTLEEARGHLTELAEKLDAGPDNVLDEPIEWSGDLGITLVVPNWRRVGAKN